MGKSGLGIFMIRMARIDAKLFVCKVLSMNLPRLLKQPGLKKFEMQLYRNIMILKT